MKKLLTVLLFCLPAALANAQDGPQFSSGREKHDGKPQLISTSASARAKSKFPVRRAFINEVMGYRLNQTVQLQVIDGFQFKGKVSAITHDAPGLETIIMQSTETKGLVLSISKIKAQDGTISYRGMMMSTNHSDMLMLERDPVTGEYFWNKKTVSHMIPD